MLPVGGDSKLSRPAAGEQACRWESACEDSIFS